MSKQLLHAFYLMFIFVAVLLIAISNPVPNCNVSLPIVLALDLLGCFIAAASCYDLCSHRIPNWLNYSAGAGALAIQCLISNAGVESASIATSFQELLVGGVACFSLTFLPWSYGGLGGGDVKLATVIGMMLGAPMGLAAILVAHVFAAIYIVAKIGYMAMPSILGRPLLVTSEEARFSFATLPASTQDRFLKQRLPMASFYASGVVAVILYAGV